MEEMVPVCRQNNCQVLILNLIKYFIKSSIDFNYNAYFYVCVCKFKKYFFE